MKTKLIRPIISYYTLLLVRASKGSTVLKFLQYARWSAAIATWIT
jgi:hypothetical protein